MSREQVANQPANAAGNAVVADPATVVTYRYDSTTSCTMSPPGSLDADVFCARAAQGCAGGANGPGPLMRIWRQPMTAGAPVGPWQHVGLTCYPDAVPTERPSLTMAMILQAFHLTPWAKAQTRVEPPGNVTLVGLDTFYRVEWSAQGYEPGEVEVIPPARMLGYRVEIRPKLVGVTYRFGDGGEFGPTPSLGGRWPDGPIRHRYNGTGQFPVSVTVTWGADFRVDGGAWAPVPDTVTVPGQSTVIQVKGARAVLVHN